MYKRLRVRRSFVALLIGVLVGGGLLVVTPAGAEVSTAAATNWKKIWKKNLQPQADKRYYTKRMSNQRYATKSALADFWTKGEADARYQPKGDYAAAGSSYTKAESDAKYARYPAVQKGAWGLEVTAAAAGARGTSVISLFPQPATAPTLHVIPLGGSVPGGCSGTVTAPEAAPGNLCIFTAVSLNATNQRAFNPTDTGSFNASPFGVVLAVDAAAAGHVYAWGTWAMRPGSSGYSASAAAPQSGGQGETESGGADR